MAKITEQTLRIAFQNKMLNVVLGGGLFCHIPEDFPQSCLPHLDVTDPNHRHVVVVSPDG